MERSGSPGFPFFERALQELEDSPGRDLNQMVETAAEPGHMRPTTGNRFDSTQLG